MCGLGEENEERPTAMSTRQKPSETRKVRKPLMEKRRRARINDSLEELKRMLSLEATPGVEQTTRPTKLEKADILELTVRHFQRLQRTVLNTGNRLQDGSDSPERKFAAGFRACAQSTKEILGEIAGLDEDVKKRLTTHLSSCLESLHDQTSSNLPRKNIVSRKTEPNFVKRNSVDSYTLPDSTQNIADCEAVNVNELVKDNEGRRSFPTSLGNGRLACSLPGLGRVKVGVGDNVKEEDHVWRPW